MNSTSQVGEPPLYVVRLTTRQGHSYELNTHLTRSEVMSRIRGARAEHDFAHFPCFTPSGNPVDLELEAKDIQGMFHQRFIPQAETQQAPLPGQSRHPHLHKH